MGPGQSLRGQTPLGWRAGGCLLTPSLQLQQGANNLNVINWKTDKGSLYFHMHSGIVYRDTDDLWLRKAA